MQRSCRFLSVVFVSCLFLSLYSGVKASGQTEVASYLIEENKRLKAENNALNRLVYTGKERANYHYYHKPRLGLWGWTKRGTKLAVVGGIIYGIYYSNMLGVQEKMSKTFQEYKKSFQEYKKKTTKEYFPQAIKFVVGFLSSEDEDSQDEELKPMTKEELEAMQKKHEAMRESDEEKRQDKLGSDDTEK